MVWGTTGRYPSCAGVETRAVHGDASVGVRERAGARGGTKPESCEREGVRKLRKKAAAERAPNTWARHVA